MAVFKVTGGKALAGEIAVSGAKNAALKLIAAALLTDEEVRLANVPEIADIARMLAVVEGLGVRAERAGHGEYTIRAKELATATLAREHAPKIRASTLLIGPLDLV